jgi:O-acetyl-ADP-ribose deacetylase (regulator of RNase III)
VLGIGLVLADDGEFAFPSIGIGDPDRGAERDLVMGLARGIDGNGPFDPRLEIADLARDIGQRQIALDPGGGGKQSLSLLLGLGQSFLEPGEAARRCVVRVGALRQVVNLPGVAIAILFFDKGSAHGTPPRDNRVVETFVTASDRITLETGDITRLAIDAIVNAANSSLLGGGGVDGAIHRAAGPELVAECRLLGGCSTGEARLTKGYRLPARHVIHTVGPVWQGGSRGEDALLAACYRNSLDLAVAHGLHRIAFPAISTGRYRFPLDRAAQIALAETLRFLAGHDTIDQVIFVCFDDATLDIYRTALARS